MGKRYRGGGEKPETVETRGAPRMGEFPEIEIIFFVKDKRLVVPVEDRK